MTQDTTNLGVEVSDGGTSKETQKRILDLKEVIKATSQAARDARKELKAMEGEGGGTAGTTAVVWPLLLAQSRPCVLPAVPAATRACWGDAPCHRVHQPTPAPPRPACPAAV